MRFKRMLLDNVHQIQIPKYCSIGFFNFYRYYLYLWLKFSRKGLGGDIISLKSPYYSHEKWVYKDSGTLEKFYPRKPQTTNKTNQKTETRPNQKKKKIKQHQPNISVLSNKKYKVLNFPKKIFILYSIIFNINMLILYINIHIYIYTHIYMHVFVYRREEGMEGEVPVN